MKIRWKPLIVSLIIPLAVGALAAYLTRDSMEVYGQLNQPPLAPPTIVFPIVWTILYVLMGISSYLVFVSQAGNRTGALTVYAIQLILNFLWPILFFNVQSYLISFIVLVLLWISVVLMIWQFTKARPVAGYLQIPYLIWVTFAGYLNLMIYLLNR